MGVCSHCRGKGKGLWGPTATPTLAASPDQTLPKGYRWGNEFPVQMPSPQGVGGVPSPGSCS